MSTLLITEQPKHIEIRGCLSKHKKSQFYQAILVYTDGAGCEVRKSRSTKQARKSDAYQVMMRMIQEDEETLYTASPGTMLVDFLQYWLDEVIHDQIEETTYCGYQLNVRNHIIPYFTPFKLRLKDLRPVHIQRFLDFKVTNPNGSSKSLKATSVQKFHANLKTALDYAVSQELIINNPARLVRGPKGKRFEASYYTIEQIALLWKACKGTVIEPAVFLTSVYGFRRGEVCGLKWEHADFGKRMIRIFETRTRAKTEVVKGTKNNSSKRSMPMMSAVHDYLKRLIKQQEANKAFCGDTWEDSEYVIVDETGKPLSFTRLQKPISVYYLKTNFLKFVFMTFGIALQLTFLNLVFLLKRFQLGSDIAALQQQLKYMPMSTLAYAETLQKLWIN